VDNRSFALNDEVNVAIYDGGMAARLEKVFADDLRHSRRLDAAQWRARGPVGRILELLAMPFREQL
jgi:cardiolipin synthase A/B